MQLMRATKCLIAVDWGTSSLRAALIDADGKVLAEHASPRGILSVKDGAFAPVLGSVVGALKTSMHGGGSSSSSTISSSSDDGQRDDPPIDLCLMSGMIGSRQGWFEAPYCPCPAGFEELASRIAWLPSSARTGAFAPAMRIGIVPGLSGEHDGVPDVMRGEEVQIAGALLQLGLDEGHFVLPGTHSKWAVVRNRRIETFSTFLTGEVYALLRRQSILARTMPTEPDDPWDEAAFDAGVEHAQSTRSLLASAFSTRALSMMNRLSASASPSYLSGLVIGEELRAQPGLPQDLTLIGAGALTARYARALSLRGCRVRTLGDEATRHGLFSIARTLRGDCIDTPPRN